jgi:NADH dehydrogenase FAD-containing subunit
MVKGKKHSVVILGAGIGGLAAALRLERRAREAECNVTVIDRDRYHCYHALLYQSATAFGLEHPERSSFLRSSAMVPICGLPHGKLLNELHMIQGEIRSIDRSKRLVVLADGTSVPYDTLICALGSVSNDFGIRGVQEYGIALKTEHDAERIRTALVRCRERAQAGEHVRCLIAGAGVSGIEIAGACGAELATLHASEGLANGSFQIELLDASPSVLPGFPTAAQRVVEQRLRALGVHIACNTKLQEITATEAICVDGTRKPYDLLIWCGGLLGHPVCQTLHATYNKKGQVEVNAFFQLPQDPSVYVIGDAATAVDPRSNSPLPQTAAVAVTEGRSVADHIISQLLHLPTPRPFQAPQATIAIPIGQHFAIAIRGQRVIVGWQAWLERKWLDWKYFRSIAPWQSAWEMFRRGFFPPLG